MNPENIDALLERADRLIEEGRAGEALRVLGRINPELLDGEDRLEWATLKAWALSEMDRTAEALELLNPLLDEFSQSARLYGTLGVILMNDDQLDDARDALEFAVSLDGDDEMLIANLALACEKMRDYNAAIELYDRALQLGADIEWALHRKASALTEAGEYSAAKSTLRRYLSLDPKDESPWISLAILHSDDEEFAEAVRCYQAAEKIAPDSPSLRLNWGVTAVRAGDLAGARVQLGELERIEPESTRAPLLRAFILEEEGKVAESRAIYEQVLQSVSVDDYGELTYALEMAMDFFSRRKARQRCVELLKRAYAENACTVELCEAYREAVGGPADSVQWYSLMVEADYRIGLSETYERGHEHDVPFTRFLRNVQVVARDRDEATAIALDFMKSMGEHDARISEFVGESPLDPTPPGIYEIERESLVFAEQAEP